MKNYFSNRPPKGYKRAIDQRIVPFRDFSTAHDPAEYRKQREALDGGQIDKAYDSTKPKTVKEVDNGNKQ